jgi:hypothetical protein
MIFVLFNRLLLLRVYELEGTPQHQLDEALTSMTLSEFFSQHTRRIPFPDAVALFG